MRASSIAAPVPDHLRSSGLEIEELETFYVHRPGPFSYAFLGRACNIA